MPVEIFDLGEAKQRSYLVASRNQESVYMLKKAIDRLGHKVVSTKMGELTDERGQYLSIDAIIFDPGERVLTPDDFEAMRFCYERQDPLIFIYAPRDTLPSPAEMKEKEHAAMVYEHGLPMEYIINSTLEHIANKDNEDYRAEMKKIEEGAVEEWSKLPITKAVNE
ncbi:MAG: hypothetical protein ACE5FT_04905 [Candidatus Nanoarchaeia archaeon]